jgi:hypothetical protein
MFKRLFNSDERSAQKLVVQLETSEDPGKIDILRTLAREKTSEALAEPLKQAVVSLLQSSSNDEVRKSAMQLIEDHRLLEAFLNDDNLAPTAAAKIIALVGSDQSNPLMADPRIISARIANASAEDVDGLIGQASSLEQLCQLAMRGNETSLHSILSKTEMRSEAALTLLEKSSRGHDKTTNRLARTQLESIRNAKSSKAANIERLAAVDDNITKTLKIKATNLDALIVQRKKLNLLNEKRSEAALAITQSEADLNASIEGEATYALAANPLANIDISVPDASSNPYPDLIKRLEQIGAAVKEENALDKLQQLIAQKQDISQAWSVASEQFPPNQSQEDIYRGVNLKVQQLANAAERLGAVAPNALTVFAQSGEKNIKRLLEANRKWTSQAEKTLSQIAWPKELTEPAVLTDFVASIQSCATLVADLSAEQKRLTSELEAMIKSIKIAIEDGRLKPASQTLSQARAIQKRGISGFEKDINALSAQVGEMRDWQDFATHPKRDQLITDLQHLVDNPLDPINQADRLKDLRRQWNALGVLRREETELQTRFDTLADQAFAVCKTHYAEQNTIKKANLQKRKALCADVQNYLQNTDWANADMQAVEGIMRAARTEWRTYHPCDIKALRTVEKEFEAAQAQLYQHIKNARDHNIAAKEAVVADAKALLELEDLEVQTTQAKALQSRWKTIGSTPRGIDQRLWREFRAACDEIFKRLETSKNAAALADKEQQKLLDEAIAAFNTKQTDPSVFRAEFETLAEMADQTEVTGEQIRKLKGLRASMEELQQTAKQAKVKSRLQQWNDWDIAVSEGEQSNEPIASPHTIFVSRINGVSADEDLEKLTLEAEIAAELASPAKDQALRMALQVELMNAGRRNMQLINNQEFIDRWCATGPKLKKHNALRKRFFKALEHRLS